LRWLLLRENGGASSSPAKTAVRDSAAPNSDEIGVKVAGMEQVQARWFVPGSGGVRTSPLLP